MTKLLAGVVAFAVSVAAAAAMAQTVDNQQMATPSASDEGVRNSVMAAAKAAPPKESQPSRNSMMSAPVGSNSPAMTSQPSVAAVRGTAPR